MLALTSSAAYRSRSDPATATCNTRVPLREENPVNIGVRDMELLADSAQNRHVQSTNAGCLLGLWWKHLLGSRDVTGHNREACLYIGADSS